MIQDVAALRAVVDDSPQATPVRFPGAVYALGTGAVSAARTYAELTGRSLRICERTDELRSLTSCDVVLCLTDRMTARLLHALYVGDAFTAPGLLTAPDEAALEALARKQARSLARSRRNVTGRVFLRAEEPSGITAGGHDVRAGGMISHAELVGLLSSDPAVLALTGHSDGIDLAVSLRAFLCPFTADAAEPSGAEKQPPCRIEGRCTKFPVRPTAQAAAAKGWLVPVSAIRARIAAIFSCSIVKVDDGVIDPALGLGATIVRDADVDVLISTWREERETADGAMLNPLIDDLSRGVPAGEAVAAYNRSALARRTGTTLALLGDPAFALEDQPAYPALPAPVYRPLPSDDAPGSAEGDAALLLAMAGDPALATADSGAGRALTELLRSGDRRDADVESALVRLLGGVFRIEDYFGVHGVPTAPSEQTPCVMCGAPARSYDVRFNALGARPRRIVRCASCMESSNLPAAWDTVPDPSRLTEGWIGLRRVPHGAHVHQTVMGYYEAIEYAEPWPLGDDGQAAEAAPLYVPAHGGLLYCKLFIVRGIEWASFGFKYRRLPDGTFWSSALVR